MLPHVKAATPTDAYIGEKIRGYRNQQKLSQEQLGTMIGVTFQQVQKYEKGINRLSGSRLQMVADIFKVPVSDLFPPTTRNGKKKDLSNVDRVIATRDGMKLVDSFATIKNETMRAAVVNLAMQFAGL